MLSGPHLTAPNQPMTVGGEDAHAVGLAVEFRAYKKSVLWQAVGALLANMGTGNATESEEAVAVVNAPSSDDVV